MREEEEERWIQKSKEHNFFFFNLENLEIF